MIRGLEGKVKRTKEEIRRAEEELRKAQEDFSKTQTEKQQIEAPVSIQDIVIIGQHVDLGFKSCGAGEYDSRGIMHNSGSVEHTNAQMRVLETIEQFVTNAANAHKANCCDSSDQLLPDKKNHITRLSTNEFLFYTNNPLELSEFQALMGEISKLAAQQPENLHLALSSFAIRAPGSFGIINVVPYIQCGPNPQINFVVKNRPSHVDPQYTQTLNIPTLGIINKKLTFPNLGIASYSIPDSTTINIGGKDCPISYNNAIKCKTAGKAEFYASIDICLDHCYETAKINFEKIENKAETSSNLSPVQKWLLITSNWVEAEESACSRRTTYADRLSDQAKEPSKRFSTKCKPKLESSLASTGMTTTFPQSSPNYKIKSYRREYCAISSKLENHNDQILKEKESLTRQAHINLEMAHHSHEDAKRQFDNHLNELYRQYPFNRRYDSYRPHNNERRFNSYRSYDNRRRVDSYRPRENDDRYRSRYYDSRRENTNRRYHHSPSDRSFLPSYDTARKGPLKPNYFKPHRTSSNRNNPRRPKRRN